MIWTSTPPQKPGYYWYRESERNQTRSLEIGVDASPVIYRVDSEGRFWFGREDAPVGWFNAAQDVLMAFFDGEWSDEPILPPDTYLSHRAVFGDVS